MTNQTVTKLDMLLGVKYEEFKPETYVGNSGKGFDVDLIEAQFLNLLVAMKVKWQLQVEYLTQAKDLMSI